eukprot:Hpha_TRINITY_DN14958_c0_g1::TRINITY_DN14958_c0_g1_i1::g.144930::m.144930
MEDSSTLFFNHSTWVRVRTQPRYGWGKLRREDKGLIVALDGSLCTVRFPSLPDLWYGELGDMEPAPPPEGWVEDVNDERQRRASFGSWPLPATPSLSPKTLAQAGFEHTPSERKPDRCSCTTCGYALTDWQGSDIPFGEHARVAPRCPFIQRVRSGRAFCPQAVTWFSQGEAAGSGGHEPPGSPVEPGVVAASGRVRLRREGSDAALAWAGSVAHGDEVHVLRRTDKWSLVSRNGGEGWLRSKYITPAHPPGGELRAGCRVRLKEQQTLGCGIVLDPGSGGRVVSVEGGRVEIRTWDPRRPRSAESVRVWVKATRVEVTEEVDALEQAVALRLGMVERWGGTTALPRVVRLLSDPPQPRRVEPPPGEKLGFLFRTFDSDRDGWWKFPEAALFASACTGLTWTDEDWQQMCGELGADPEQGLSENAVGRLLLGEGGEIHAAWEAAEERMRYVRVCSCDLLLGVTTEGLRRTTYVRLHTWRRENKRRRLYAAFSLHTANGVRGWMFEVWTAYLHLRRAARQTGYRELDITGEEDHWEEDELEESGEEEASTGGGAESEGEAWDPITEAATKAELPGTPETSASSSPRSSPRSLPRSCTNAAVDAELPETLASSSPRSSPPSCTDAAVRVELPESPHYTRQSPAAGEECPSSPGGKGESVPDDGEPPTEAEEAQPRTPDEGEPAPGTPPGTPPETPAGGVAPEPAAAAEAGDTQEAGDDESDDTTPPAGPPPQRDSA